MIFLYILGDFLYISVYFTSLEGGSAPRTPLLVGLRPPFPEMLLTEMLLTDMLLPISVIFPVRGFRKNIDVEYLSQLLFLFGNLAS